MLLWRKADQARAGHLVIEEAGYLSEALHRVAYAIFLAQVVESEDRLLRY